MRGSFAPKRRVLGFSLIEMLIGMGTLAIVASAVGSLSFYYFRNQKANQLKNTYGDIVRRVSSTLKNPSAIRKSARNSAYEGNTNLLNCLYDEGSADNNNANDCVQSAIPFPPATVLLTDPALSNQLSSLATRQLQIRLVDSVNQLIHGPGKTYWTAAGVPCDGADGRPTPSSPASFCPIESGVFYQAACNPTNNLSQRATCEIATHFRFFYTVKIREGANVPGGALLRPYNSHLESTLDPIVYSTPDLVRLKIANARQCNTDNGEVMTGIDSSGDLICSKIETQKHLLARHSMRNSVPNCNFSVLRSGTTVPVAKSFPSAFASGVGGYSFAGAWISAQSGAVPDLGKPGSCLVVSNLSDIMSRVNGVARTDFFAEMDDDMPFRAWGTGNDFSMWMRATNVTPPSVPLADFPNTAPYVSRCNVCEIDGPVIAVHNFNLATPDAPPACPAGWDRLYTGRALAAMTLHASDGDSGFNHGTNLSSPGSCLPIAGTIDPIPFFECKHYTSDGDWWGPGTPPQCQHRTPGDFALWYARDNARAFQCSVCYKPSRIEPQPLVWQAIVIGN